MDRSRYRGMTEEQLEDLVCGLPRREPPPALRDRVLARARPCPASVVRSRLAFAALVLLVTLDVAVLRWQDADLAARQAPRVAIARTLREPRDDLLALVQQTYHGRAWQLSLATRPQRTEGYLQFRDRSINMVDRG